MKHQIRQEYGTNLKVGMLQYVRRNETQYLAVYNGCLKDGRQFGATLDYLVEEREQQWHCLYLQPLQNNTMHISSYIVMAEE